MVLEGNICCSYPIDSRLLSSASPLVLVPSQLGCCLCCTGRGSRPYATPLPLCPALVSVAFCLLFVLIWEASVLTQKYWTFSPNLLDSMETSIPVAPLPGQTSKVHLHWLWKLYKSFWLSATSPHDRKNCTLRLEGDGFSHSNHYQTGGKAPMLEIWLQTTEAM